MVNRLSKRLHDLLCKAIHDDRGECLYKDVYINLAIKILGTEYVFITTEEFANLRETVITI